MSYYFLVVIMSLDILAEYFAKNPSVENKLLTLIKSYKILIPPDFPDFSDELISDASIYFYKSGKINFLNFDIVFSVFSNKDVLEMISYLQSNEVYDKYFIESANQYLSGELNGKFGTGS